MPSFDVPSGKTERLDRVRIQRFGNPASAITGRASRPVAGERTIRDLHHKVRDPMPSPIRCDQDHGHDDPTP